MDQLLIGFIVTAALAFFGWLGVTMHGTASAVAKMSVTLHGEKGDNGIASEVRGHRKRLHRLGQVATHCVNGIYRLEEIGNVDHLPIPQDSAE